MKVINFNQTVRRDKEHRAKMNEEVLHKQSMIENLVKRLQSATIDDKTMALLLDIHSVLLAVWAVGNLQAEYEKHGQY